LSVDQLEGVGEAEDESGIVESSISDVSNANFRKLRARMMNRLNFGKANDPDNEIVDSSMCQEIASRSMFTRSMARRFKDNSVSNRTRSKSSKTQDNRHLKL
jgi:hypothetical protein